MVLLIDTNVLIDYIVARDGFYVDADKIFDFCSDDENQGYIAFHSLSNIWYFLRKRNDEYRREMLRNICTVFIVTGASHDNIVDAIEKTDFKDFEDCLQDKCAVTVNADYIITRNVKDFQNAETKIMTPADFVMQFIDERTK